MIAGSLCHIGLELPDSLHAASKLNPKPHSLLAASSHLLASWYRSALTPQLNPAHMRTNLPLCAWCCPHWARGVEGKQTERHRAGGAPMQDALCETAYQAEVAGLSFEVAPEGAAGLALRLDGFSHRLPALAAAVFRALATLKAPPLPP